MNTTRKTSMKMRNLSLVANCAPRDRALDEEEYKVVKS